MKNNTSLYRKTKGKFFLKLHSRLAKKYRTDANHLSLKKIGYIREHVLGKKMDKISLIKLLEKNMFQEKRDRDEPIEWYLRINSFVKSCSKDVWKDILQITEYDKGYPNLPSLSETETDIKQTKANTL